VMMVMSAHWIAGKLNHQMSMTYQVSNPTNNILVHFSDPATGECTHETNEDLPGCSDPACNPAECPTGENLCQIPACVDDNTCGFEAKDCGDSGSECTLRRW